MHILLRPVPGLSATLEKPQSHLSCRRRKYTNIDSAIPRQAPPAITGHKNDTTWHRQECAPRNLDSRLPGTSCVGTRREGGGLSTPTTPIPARGRRSSTVPTSITDAISTATSSQPPADLSVMPLDEKLAQEIVDKGDPHLIRSSTIDRDRWQYEQPEPDHERER